MFVRLPLFLLTAFLTNISPITKVNTPVDNKAPISYTYPAYTYVFPLYSYMGLTGTFGELRANHFHTGIDIKCGGSIGVPVRAVESGYISRISVSAYNYGHSVYIRHPDGNTSHYAHLNAFEGLIAEKVFNEQRKSETFDQYIELRPGEMPIAKGQRIGYTGNTGSSQGPHLHFEIRDSLNRFINPLLYFRSYVPDHIPPVIQTIGFEPLGSNSLIFNRFEKYTVQPKGKNGVYEIETPIQIDGPVGLEYQTYDLLDNYQSRCGINKVRLYVDERLIYEYELWRLASGEALHINQHVDYRLFKEQKEWMEKAYIDEINPLNTYNHAINKGIIQLADDALHTFRLELYDGYENKSIVHGKLQRVSPATLPSYPLAISSSPLFTHWVYRNTLVIKIDHPTAQHWKQLKLADEYGTGFISEPIYYQEREQRLTYLVPLDKFPKPTALVDSNDEVLHFFNLWQEISPEETKTIEYGKLTLDFPKGLLYRPMHLSVGTETDAQHLIGEAYRIGNPSVPLRGTYHIHFPYLPLKDLDKICVAQKGSRENWYFAGKPRLTQKGLSLEADEFGTFGLRLDTLAPQIYPINFISNSSRALNTDVLRLKIRDDFSDVDSRSVKGYLDGQWVLFTYDYKRELISHELKTKPTKGVHTLEVWVSDRAGNATHELFTILVR